jgi:spore coat polysaccharide biosynthesis protein SpsF
MGGLEIAVGVVIQARMGSTRLPGKVMRPIGPLPLLGHILERLRALRHSAKIVVATTTNTADTAIEEYCEAQGTTCFRGSELDVLSRYVECARRFDFQHVVRLTADNPFIDAEELDRLIALHLERASDYASSLDGLPIGVGAEIFARALLERSHEEGRAPHHREHVNEYVLENLHLFKVARLAVSPKKARPDVRLTVDTESDYRRACHIVANARTTPVGTEEAIALCLRSA